MVAYHCPEGVQVWRDRVLAGCTKLANGQSVIVYNWMRLCQRANAVQIGSHVMYFGRDGRVRRDGRRGADLPNFGGTLAAIPRAAICKTNSRLKVLLECVHRLGLMAMTQVL